MKNSSFLRGAFELIVSLIRYFTSIVRFRGVWGRVRTAPTMPATPVQEVAFRAVAPLTITTRVDRDTRIYADCLDEAQREYIRLALVDAFGVDPVGEAAKEFAAWQESKRVEAEEKERALQERRERIRRLPRPDPGKRSKANGKLEPRRNPKPPAPAEAYQRRLTLPGGFRAPVLEDQGRN